MGFSLQAFFNELEYIIKNSSIFTVIPKVSRYVMSQKQYAKDCGLIK